MRERYGRNTFGQSCLMARRLVERGVPYVTINYKGWDTHKQHFQIMRRKLPELDRGSPPCSPISSRAACSTDRRLGRRRIRPHAEGAMGAALERRPQPLGQAFSALVAGGGFKGGHVVGSSDARGEEVADRPTHPCDLIASTYELLGIDPEARLPHPEGADIRAIPTVGPEVKRGGRLSEIM
jgi:hypothetical protein